MVVSQVTQHFMCHVMRKPAFCIWENKRADQLHSNCTADQRLCFRYIDSTIPLLSKPKFQACSHILWLHSQVCVRPGQIHRFFHDAAYIDVFSIIELYGCQSSNSGELDHIPKQCQFAIEVPHYTQVRCKWTITRLVTLKTNVYPLE